MKAIIESRISRALNALRMPFRMVIDRVTTGKGVKKVYGEGLASETVKGAELFQQYGLSSCPPGGTMAVVVPLGGVSTHAMVVATEHAAFGVNLATGEVAVYHQEGHFMHFKNGRIIEVECDEYRVSCKRFQVTATEGASVTTPRLVASGQVEINGLVTGKGGLALSNEGGDAARINGKIDVSEDVIAGGISVVKHHHRESDGGQTDAPSK